MQAILLLLYILRSPISVIKRRNRDRRRHDISASVTIIPTVDPNSALELLLDRLSVWQAVAELGIGLDEDNGKGKSKDSDDGILGILRRFWEDIMIVLQVYFVVRLKHSYLVLASEQNYQISVPRST